MDQTQQYVNCFAEEGLRTLLLARKPIEASVYEEWNVRFQQAMGEVVNKDEKVDMVQDEIELGMTLVGSTAIEDRL